MFHNNLPAVIHSTATENILGEMANAPHTFYLTGSRFTGLWHNMSDWDFFCDDTKNTREFLIKLGFKARSTSHYKDNSVTIVYTHPGNPVSIDVQMVKLGAVLGKYRANIIIKSIHPYLKQLTKREIRHIWENLISLQL